MADQCSTLSTFDIILMFGPDMGNKCDYLPPTFWSENAEIICPEDLYLENAEYGLRDIALKIVSSLRQNKQVLIDDELRSRSMRKSLLETIKKKVPSCRVQLVQLIPQYGLLQVMWSLQLAQAAGVVKAASKHEEHLRNWFDSSLQKIDYSTGFVDKPSEKEGYAIETVTVPLQVKSHFKLDIPALLFQWEGAMNMMEDLNSQVKTLCSYWAAQNPCGRILFICDGRNVSRGMIPAADETNNIVRILKQLSVTINHPVYAIQLHAASSSRNFCVPPQPGILAFLQLHQLLNLHSKSTCYVFEDVNHMKMAEAAGMRHVKITSVLKSPGMVLKGYGSHPSVPAMLKSMVVETPSSRCKNTLAQTPTVPIFGCQLNMTDGHASHRFENGLEEHVFVKDVQSFRLYQEKCEQHVTATDHPDNSCISKSPTEPCGSTTIEKISARVTRSSSEDSTDIKIPHWMRRKKPRLPSEEESVITCPQKTVGKGVAKSSRSYKTVYIMSEKEVLEMARQVLLEVRTQLQSKPKKQGNTTPANEGNTTPANEGNTTPANEGNTTPANEGNTTPANEGNTTPANEGNTTPANEGNTTPANEGNTTPANEGNTTPANEGNTTPANEGNTTPANEGNTTPANEGNTTPANEGNTTPANEGNTTPANDFQ